MINIILEFAAKVPPFEDLDDDLIGKSLVTKIKFIFNGLEMECDTSDEFMEFVEIIRQKELKRRKERRELEDAVPPDTGE